MPGGEKAGFAMCPGIAFECHIEAHLLTADVAQDDDDLFSFMNSTGRDSAALSG